MAKAKSIVVAGHICLDITPVFPSHKVANIGEVLAPGNLVMMDGVSLHVGGAVGNTGMALRKIGVDACLMGKIGKDSFGDIILKLLARYRGGKGMVVDKNAGSSYSVVLAIPGVDRMFLHDPGINDNYCVADLDFKTISEATIFHFGYPQTLKAIYKNEGEELIKMLEKVKALNIPTSLDMVAMDPKSEGAKEDWSKIAEKMLPLVDFFVPSVEELYYTLDKERYQALVATADGKDITEIISREEIKDLGDKSIELGAKVVLIKCGAAGIYYQTTSVDKMTALCEELNLNVEDWADKEGFETSYVPRRIASGTGAGDTCIAAFLASILREYQLEKAVQLAAAEGACCVEEYDSLSGLKTLDELEEKIQQGWAKNK